MTCQQSISKMTYSNLKHSSTWLAIKYSQNIGSDLRGSHGNVFLNEEVGVADNVFNDSTLSCLLELMMAWQAMQSRGPGEFDKNVR